MTNLNSILSRWWPEGLKAVPVLDCAACTKKWKCCDFQPFLPNFAVGAILEQRPEFELSGPHHWQPLGLIPSHEFRERHGRTSPEARERDLVCQFFDPLSRGCGIWEFRPGECSHYFCEGMGAELIRGSESAFAVETALAQKALFALGFGVDQVGEQIDLLNSPGAFPVYQPAELRKIYRECWRWAGNLQGGEVGQWA